MSVIATNNRLNSFTESIEFVIEQCCNCGVPFAMSRETYRQHKANGECFYCPYGHTQRYTETTESKLRKDLAKERQRADQAAADAAFQRQMSAQAEKTAEKARAETKRLRKRAASGVCACCNRFFPDLHSHMTTQHPEVQKELAVQPAPPRRRVRAGGGRESK